MLAEFQADVPGVEASRAIGMGVGMLIPVTIALHGFKRMSSPDNNRKCGLSLGLAGGGWAVSSLGYMITSLKPDLKPLLMASSAVTMFVTVLAVVMAILGLIEMAGTPRQVRGKGQAVGTFIIGGILGIAFFVGLYLGATSAKIPSDWKLPAPTPGARLSFPDKNYSLTAPDSDWDQVLPTKLNPLADAAFFNKHDGIFFIAIGTNLPPGATATQEKLVEISRGELLGADPSATVGPSMPEAVGTLQGTSFGVEATVQKSPLSYRYWVYSAGSRVYQLVTWGPRSSAAKVPEAAAKLRKGFALLGP